MIATAENETSSRSPSPLRGEGGMVDPGQQELLDEMLSFPLGKHDDLLAAADLFDIREPSARPGPGA
jgi:phage terminase large subunit-like protein